MWIALAVVGIVVVVAVVFMLARRNRKPANFADAETYRKLMGVQSPGHAPAAPATPALDALRQNLRIKYLYQEDKIDAAIAYERECSPAASDEQLMKNAIARWERDNG